MTNREWNMGLEYLMNAEVGDYVEHEGRIVVVGNMIGGRFECYADHEFITVVETEVEAMMFLANGKYSYER